MVTAKKEKNYQNLPWEIDLPCFLQNYFSNFLRVALNEFYAKGDVLNEHLQLSFSVMKSLGCDTNPTLHTFYKSFSSFFNSSSAFGNKLPSSLDKAIWWTLFNNLESPLDALCCVSYLGNGKDRFTGDVYLGFRTIYNQDSKQPNYFLDDIEWLSWKLAGTCLHEYSSFIRKNIRN